MIDPWGWQRRALLARSVALEPLRGPILVVAPHPDDETIGAGALIARTVAAGEDVRVLIVSDGGASHASRRRSDLVERRRAEALVACGRLGVDSAAVEFLDLPDQDVGSHRPRLDDALAGHCDVRWVVGPSGRDANPDHRATAAAIVCAFGRRPGTATLWYPVWYWHRWAWMDPELGRAGRLRRLLVGPVAALRSTTTAVVDDPISLAAKRHALAAYTSQLEGHEHDTAGLDRRVVERACAGPELLFVGPDR